MAKPKVLVLSAPPAYGGGEVYVERLAELLDKHYRFVIMTSLGSWRRRLGARGLETWPLVGAVRFYSIWGVRLYRLLLPLYWLQLAVALWRWRPSLIWVQSNEERLAVMTVARWFGLPVVWTLHGPVDPSGSIWYRQRFEAAAQETAAVICVSEHVKTAAVAAGVPTKSCRVIYNGVAVPAEAAPALPEATVAFIGRLEIEKGPDTLVAAALRVLETHPESRFVIAGDGTLGPALRQQALPGGQSIQFLGWAEAAKVLAANQIIVAPSRVEAQGLAVLEAMAAGRPVVASGVGGLAEMIKDGANGLLVTPDDPAALAAAITRLLDDQALRRKLGTAARTYAKEHHDPLEWADQTKAALEKALS